MYRHLLCATALLVLPTAAFANCPATMTTTARLNCLNAALNAAAATITTLQTSNAALDTANAALETGMWSLEAQLEDAETRLDLHDDDIADLLSASSDDAAFTALQSDVANLAANVADLSTTVGALDVGDLFTYLSVDTATNSVIFSGANVYVQNGSGATDGAVNGLGNLIVGYDEDTRLAYGLESDRTGSHNLVVGMGHSYSSYGGLVTGTLNTVSAQGSAVIGGVWNTASGIESAIVAGASNNASGFYASTLGGSGNSATGDFSAAAGGGLSTAGGNYAAILGGTTNSTTTDYQTVSGGYLNTATGTGATVSGGQGNDAGGMFSSIFGGYEQTTSADYETIPAAGGVDSLSAYVTVDTATNSVIFSGANVYVQSGSGSTDGAVNGLGNLIIGYDETPDDLGYGMYVESDRSGSHNLVVGMGHAYTSYGGFVAGTLNSVDGHGASVCGGEFNVAGGLLSTVSGGILNHANGNYTSVAGGSSNGANGEASAVLGGSTNSASAAGSTVSGGIYNNAGGLFSAILGGAWQTTSEDDETYPE